MSEGRVKSITVECGRKEFPPPHFYALTPKITTKPNVRRVVIQILKH